MKRTTLEAIKAMRKLRDINKVVARPNSDKLRKSPPRTSVKVTLP